MSVPGAILFFKALIIFVHVMLSMHTHPFPFFSVSGCIGSCHTFV